MKYLLTLIGIVMSVALAHAEPRPVVLELYTSEGCSSCPPAEQYLGELAKRSDVLALAFHVDYWDDGGWRDRFSSPAATLRQRRYGETLALASVYTPQVIVEGTQSYVGSSRSDIEPALRRGVRDATPIALTVTGSLVRVSVGAARPGTATNEVVLVAYLRTASTAVGRGENAGRTIQESNVVRGLKSLGVWRGAPQTWDIDVRTLPQDATDVAVLIQRSPQGQVLGAAHTALR